MPCQDERNPSRTGPTAMLDRRRGLAIAIACSTDSSRCCSTSSAPPDTRLVDGSPRVPTRIQPLPQPREHIAARAFPAMPHQFAPSRSRLPSWQSPRAWVRFEARRLAPAVKTERPALRSARWCIAAAAQALTMSARIEVGATSSVDIQIRPLRDYVALATAYPLGFPSFCRGFVAR